MDGILRGVPLAPPATARISASRSIGSCRSWLTGVPSLGLVAWHTFAATGASQALNPSNSVGDFSSTARTALLTSGNRRLSGIHVIALLECRQLRPVASAEPFGDRRHDFRSTDQFPRDRLCEHGCDFTISGALAKVGEAEAVTCCSSAKGR
jgi:hypothetical protein